MKVEEPTTPTTTFTEYSYDTLGNLTQVRAAKGASGNDLLGAPITTTMTYDSLSKKRTMMDPDMGYWTYDYDKSGNLTYQTDAKGQTITFRIRWAESPSDPEIPIPDRTVTYTYDDASSSQLKGKADEGLGSWPIGESETEGGSSSSHIDLMQRATSSQEEDRDGSRELVDFQQDLRQVRKEG